MTTQDKDTPSHLTTLFEQLPNPGVEFKLGDDGEPIIVHANAAFRDTFAAAESVTGLPVNELIVPVDQHAEATAFDQQSADRKPNQAVVEGVTHSGRRKFHYDSIPINNNHGFIIYSDITEQYYQNRQLDVLHRVLRHNLRNDVTIISGQAELAYETVDTEEARQALESVRETASALLQLCSEAQTIRRVTGEPSTLEPVPLMDSLWPVIEDCRAKFPAATISVDCPADLAVMADDRLRIVVDSLVDNAARHNTSSTPKVNISASAVAEDTVELAVADDGPGIPASEQRVIRGNVEVSPLSHGSGLGLWLVKWLTESYGGSLDIETPADGGSVVCFQLAEAKG